MLVVSGLIRIYQLTLSPDHGFVKVLFPQGVCRYYPTCSQYALQAVERHGLVGVLLSMRRLRRCHPYAAGGHDPVPPAP
jgi:hypothetical protein